MDPDNYLWESFKRDMDNFHGLKWDFSGQEDTVHFLDIKVTTNTEGEISTDLFEKELNPYLYITPDPSPRRGPSCGSAAGRRRRRLRAWWDAGGTGCSAVL